MRKSTLFISAVLTTFMLAILVGVVSAYRGTINSANSSSNATTSPATEVAVVNTDTPQPTAETSTILTPEQAAALAAQILGRTDLLSVETSLLNGVSVYLVSFLSGDQVYVSPEGMILSIVQATPTAPAPSVASSSGGGHKRGGGGTGGGSGGGSGGGGGTGGGGGGGDDGGGGGGGGGGGDDGGGDD
jgi:hypothetical protein